MRIQILASFLILIPVLAQAAPESPACETFKRMKTESQSNAELLAQFSFLSGAVSSGMWGMARSIEQAAFKEQLRILLATEKHLQAVSVDLVVRATLEKFESIVSHVSLKKGESLSASEVDRIQNRIVNYLTKSYRRAELRQSMDHIEKIWGKSPAPQTVTDAIAEQAANAVAKNKTLAKAIANASGWDFRAELVGVLRAQKIHPILAEMAAAKTEILADPVTPTMKRMLSRVRCGKRVAKIGALSSVTGIIGSVLWPSDVAAATMTEEYQKNPAGLLNLSAKEACPRLEADPVLRERFEILAEVVQEGTSIGNSCEEPEAGPQVSTQKDAVKFDLPKGLESNPDAQAIQQALKASAARPD